MANGAPNHVNLIPDDRMVFRALTLPGWYRRGKLTYRAFVLRSDENEEEISLGLSAEGALIGLDGPTYGFARLFVGEIHGLNKGLTVRPNAENQQKAELWGLPPWPEEEDQRDVAITVAKDLANISEYVPPLLVA